MTTQTHRTDLGNGFEGVIVNETLNAELEKRYLELEKMNKQSNWTKEIEERESVLYKEIEDLREAKEAFEDKY